LDRRGCCCARKVPHAERKPNREIGKTHAHVAPISVLTYTISFGRDLASRPSRRPADFGKAQAALASATRARTWRRAMALRKFIIERDIPKVGTFEREQLRAAAAKSNEVLHQLGPDIQWVESYVADNKTFCVYLAKDEAIIRKHAEVSGFPATKITEVKKMIDPTTAAA
jgi:Protein of unknown function (DUF4242)